MPSILFICTANRFRSPLAAAMLQRELQATGIASAWDVASAGLWATPGLPALPRVISHAQALGLDLSRHRSSRVNGEMVTGYDLLVTMEAGHREALLVEFPALGERVRLLAEVAEGGSYDIPDAWASESEMSAVVRELDSLVRRGMVAMCAAATRLSETRGEAARRDAHHS